ncbi:MAG: cobalamin-dependent protein [Methanophagales archaeon]|nr:cobalamin-dependent protein [Methanophagales archaeon]
MDNEIVLVNPFYQKRLRAIVTTLAHQPLGLAYIAAILGKAGFKVRIIDANVEQLSNEQVMKKIADIGPKIVGFTAVTSTIGNCHKLAKGVKSINPDITTIVGGIHVTAVPEGTLREYPSFDYVVRGEGEYTMLELVKALYEFTPVENVTGITYRNKECIISTPPRHLIENLDELPFPARHLLPVDLYKSPESEHVVQIMASRGCPYKCIYCASYLIFGRRRRARSPKNVVDEMESVNKKYHISTIIFLDDIFTLSKNWVSNFCEEILDRNLDYLRWVCCTRCDTINKDLLNKMKKAGCKKINLGIESGSQSILDYMRRDMTVDAIR